MNEWLPTHHGEWYCPDVALVACSDGRWYAYPCDGSHALGPFASLLEAQAAAEAYASRELPAPDLIQSR